MSFDILKVANGANFDRSKITGASLLFQTDFPRLLFDNYIVRKINQNKCSDTKFHENNLCSHSGSKESALTVKKLYMLIIKINKNTNIQKNF